MRSKWEFESSPVVRCDKCKRLYSAFEKQCPYQHETKNKK